MTGNPMNKAAIGIVEKLEPCPFCREPDAFAERADFSSSYVVCNNCLARGPTCCQDGDDEDEPGKDAAIAQWNTRTPDPIIMEMVEALDTLLRKERRRYHNAPASEAFYRKEFATELALLAKVRGK